MTTAWTNTQIQTTYGDGLQLGNSGGGILTSLQRLRDGLGTASCLQLSTTTLYNDGTLGFLVPNGAGYTGNPGGYRILLADGVTAVTLMSINAANNADLVPENLCNYVGCYAHMLLRHGHSYYIESHDLSQDLVVVSVSDDASNNLHIGNATFAGSTQLGDTYLDLQTGKALHVVINTTEVFKIDANGNAAIGLTAPANTSTNGFPCVPLMGAAPTGAFTPPAGFAGMVVDSANNKLWFRYGGNWKFAALS